MNPGELNRKINILRAAGDKDIRWGTVRAVWSAVTEGKTGLIAPLAVKTAAIEAVIRETEITEGDALVFRGEHYLITSILQDTEHPIYLRVQAAKSPVYIAEIYRPVKKLSDLGATVWEPELIGSSVCCLAEKYVNNVTGTGHDETATELIMATPKLCELEEGDSVEVLSERWKVMAAYLMDLYKNQYKLRRVRDN